MNKDLKKLKSLCEFPDVLSTDLKIYREMDLKNDIDYKSIFSKTVEFYN